MEKKEEMRKGPWTEHEDGQLGFYVNLFGDRRWDFVAKVSGLRRTGKSCRLRWVNYLHPGLKRGRMTPHEERLVLDLHSKWGNRWSRIARKLPGRTDNEIKNYWRTHMRKEAQEKKREVVSRSSSSSKSTSVSSCSNIDSGAIPELAVEESGGVYSMDEIWRDIELSEESIKIASPVWDFSLWSMEEEADHFHSFSFNDLV